MWSFDGSCSYWAEGNNSDVYLHPVALYRDPFRQGNNKIVLCETSKYNKKATQTNHRWGVEVRSRSDRVCAGGPAAR